MIEARKQDLPPPGGYEKIAFERNPGRVLFKGRYLFAGYVGLTVAGLFFYQRHHKEVMLNRLERQGGLNAVYPFILAERDRAFLKRVHYNREQEREVMKDVEGWEIGTFHGEPIYKTVNPDQKWVDPIFEDFYVGVAPSDWEDKALRRFSC